MTIIEPKVELLEQQDAVSHVARCARVCYDKETGNNDKKLYYDLIKKNHWSPFRHFTYYAIAPYNNDFVCNIISNLWRSRLKAVGIDVESGNKCYYIVYNGNWALDNPDYHQQLSDFHVSPEEFANASECAWNMMHYTFRITTQISTSRELNRVSPNNITELSTRYVDLKNGAICRPHWMAEEEAENWNDGLVDNLSIRTETYCRSCDRAFDDYRKLIEQFDFRREDARGILPLDTATKVIYTYSWPEWKHIIELRSDKRAHPNCQIIANMIKKELEELGYDFK